MAKIRTTLADAKPFENMPKGWYQGRIKSAVYKDSAASIARGAPEKMFEITFTVMSPGDFLNRDIPYYTLSLAPGAAFMREKFLDDIQMERTCLACNMPFTESAKIAKEESKINKSGLGCPHCHSQGDTEWDAGTPEGQMLMHKACQIHVEPRKSNKQGDDREFDSVTDTARLR